LPKGPKTLGELPPKRATTGTLIAQARCNGPVSPITINHNF